VLQDGLAEGDRKAYGVIKLLIKPGGIRLSDQEHCKAMNPEDILFPEAAARLERIDSHGYIGASGLGCSPVWVAT
jgi:hypothetical protein